MKINNNIDIHNGKTLITAFNDIFVFFAYYDYFSLLEIIPDQ